MLNTNLFFNFPVGLKVLLDAMNNSGLGTVFFLNSSGKLKGVLTDGDLRRAILDNLNINDMVDEGSGIYNHYPRTLPPDFNINDIWPLFKSGIKVIPIVDLTGKVLDYVTQEKIRPISISQPVIGISELNNVMGCMETGWISSQGSFIAEFEESFSRYFGGGFPLAVSNGTVALQLGLVALNIGPGDEVLVPNYTFGASINSIIHAGATPVLVDVNLDNWTIDLAEAQKLITNKSKAIMPVHIYGQPALMDEIVALSKIYNLKIIEDCAESLGGTYKGRKVGLDGDCSCFSFFANKIITTGEGGMVLFKDKNIAEKAKILRDHGMSKEKKYWHEYAGFNFRMTNLQAAIGVAQMGRLDEFLRSRKSVFAAYDFYLKNTPELTLLPSNSWSENSCWLYTLIVNNIGEINRDKLIVNLRNNGIESRPGFYPMSEMPVYKKYVRTNMPNSVYLAANSISLPTSSDLSRDTVAHICSVLTEQISFLSEPAK